MRYVAIMSVELRSLIRERRITLLEIAKRTGVDQSTVTRWVSGERIPGVDLGVRLAKAIDAEHRKRGPSGVTDDWPAYEAEFMARYSAELDKRNPPGWAAG